MAPQTEEALDRIKYAIKHRHPILSLRELDLEEVPDQLQELIWATHIDLGDNDLRTIPVFFQDFHLLENLDLSGNRISEFPNAIAELSNLVILDISRNYLQRIPSGLRGLKKLQTLWLTSNELVEFPADIDSLRKLRSLMIGSNRFDHIPDVFGGLRRLRYVSFPNNRVREIPLSLLVHPTLETLIAYGNLISAINLAGGLGDALNHLDLSDNQITEVPAAIGSSQGLQILDLSGNEIRDLPTEFSQLNIVAEEERKGRSMKSGLLLQFNPLKEPLLTICNLPQPEATNDMFAWLRGGLRDKYPEQNSPDENLPPHITQGFGPHFSIGDDGVIDFLAAEHLDSDGNNIGALEALKPSLLALSDRAISLLSAGNMPHAILLDALLGYRDILSADLASMNFPVLYVQGVILQNTFDAIQIEISRGDRPELDAGSLQACRSLLQIHAPFILATTAGQAMIDAEGRYQRTVRQEAAYRDALLSFTESLQGRAEIVEPRVANFLVSASNQVGHGSNAERSGVVATGSVKNAAVAILSTATIPTLLATAASTGSPTLAITAGTLAFLGGESLKKSKAFSYLVGRLSSGIDVLGDVNAAEAINNLINTSRKHSAFVRSVAPQLRKIAGSNKSFSWIDETLDWIEKHQEK